MGFLPDLIKNNFAAVSLGELVNWRKHEGPGVLRLPPIQRSLVWRNEQIVQYWDSLLRGYPAGQFLVHRVSDAGRDNTAGRSGSDAEGHLETAHPDDWQLFDGQQRMSALLLGRAEGQLHEALRLWIDFGTDPTPGSDLRFALRISSHGQPFGYRADAPNSKFEVSKRSKMWAEFEEESRDTMFDGDVELIDAVAAVPMARVWAACVGGAGEWTKLREELRKSAPEEAQPAIDKRFKVILDAFGAALSGNALVSRLPTKIVESPEEYLRFFGRVGQGGTALTNDELTYSILKQQFPHLRDRMANLRDLRFASDVDLVLATLRVARLRVERGNSETARIARPTPEYVREMNDEVRKAFLQLLPDRPGEDFAIRQDLNFIKEALRKRGMHSMLTARLPREAIDILLLLAEIMRGADASDPDKDFGDLLLRVTLFCLLGTDDPDKAANALFEMASGSEFSVANGGLSDWRRRLEDEGRAYNLPTNDDFKAWRAALSELEQDPRKAAQLPGWAERYIGRDTDTRRPGDWMRRLTSSRELTKRALMWAQRDYLKVTAPTFDPLSARDDDLPLDLDHIVPRNDFKFHWSEKERRAKQIEDAYKDSFHRHRGNIGDGLGNFRWLCARENRKRKDGPIAPSEQLDIHYIIDDYDAWNALVGDSCLPWPEQRIANFRTKTERRAIRVAQRLAEDMDF
ncbi:DUF262 domain-containing protein [Thalassorhabdomicrobium marinisediminis]|uniref:DUF262 domain-containing protein n=1 Tax=Thalassorhabdomicrobium marinisediminis TaxID=2170577 RepID=UPI00248F999F|nr:DUF262 domain-containing protein [Thalassorhabdomicrobium marinisediminis]